MKIKQKAIFLAIFLMTGSCFANLKSSNITLTGGTINPHETLSISLSPLMPDVAYKVIAKITDPNNKKNKVILKAGQDSGYGFSYDNITVNGTWISGSQFSLNQIENTVEFTNLFGIDPITITNLDDTDSVTVTAIATPIVNN